MKLFAVAATLSLVTPAFPWTGTYALQSDDVYDHKNNSLSTVACSSGEYGLLTRGFKTFGDLPTFPYIGGAPQVLEWNLRYCGTCWELSHTDRHGVSTSLNFTAIDASNDDPGAYVISSEGMDLLAHGHTPLDGIRISAVLLPKESCGL